MSARIELPNALVDAAAKAYYEWVTVNAEPSRWYEDSPSGEQARSFARHRAEIILRAALDTGLVMLTNASAPPQEEPE